MKINKKGLRLKETLFSGQCFRMKENDGIFSVILNDRIVFIKENSYYIEVESDVEENLEHVITHYFDLNRDYDEINKLLIVNNEFRDVVKKMNGYKILKQDNFEMFISYIISQNNNVKKIMLSIELLCKKFGTKKSYKDYCYYLFPTYEQLKNATLEELNMCKLGFRSKYVLNALEYLKKQPNLLNELVDMSTDKAINSLMEIVGIGEKVASCILMFGYGKFDVYPIDIWVKKYCLENYGIKDIKSIKELFFNKFGEYSGLMVQYIFHYNRNVLKKNRFI